MQEIRGSIPLGFTNEIKHTSEIYDLRSLFRGTPG